MITLSINVQVNMVIPDDAQAKRRIASSVEAAAEYVRQVWMSAVSGTVLPGMSGPVNDPEYLRSLGSPTALRMVSEYEAVVSADWSKVQGIEEGYGSFDMKPMLLGGPRARMTKDGRRYTIIPFRFGTPVPGGGSRPHFPGEMTMPRHVYNVVRLGTEYNPDDTEGMRTKIADYVDSFGTFGGVNAEAGLRGMQPPMDDNYTWQAGLYAGMRGYGDNKHRQYYTFRTVSTPAFRVQRTQLANGKIATRRVKTRGSDPNSWIHPGRSANPVMQAVVDATQANVRNFLRNSVAAVALPFLRP